MKARSKTVFVLIAVVLVGVAAWRLYQLDAPASAKNQPPTLVKVEAPKRAAVTPSLRLTGDVQPIQQTQIFARVYGNLQSLEANIGDHVRAGQVLARVDTIELAQQYRQASATYENAAMILERAKALQSDTLISKQGFDSVATSTEIARENKEAAKTRLDYAQITAPFSGVITRRYLDAGALLTSTNANLFLLMDLDTMKIIVNVLEKDIPSIKVGAQAVITVEAYPGREFGGSVARLSQALDLDTRTMPVEIDVRNPDYDLKPGMFASISVLTGEPVNALTIPTQALLKDAKGYFVLVADKDQARRVDVTIGVEQQSRSEVLTGLTDTDKVITTGQQFARDGGRITVQP